MDFSDSRLPEPYPLSIRIRWFLERLFKVVWRVSVVVLAAASLCWTSAFFLGCSGLKTALEEVNADPTLNYTAPANWDKPAEGENAAPYFAASFALLSYAYSEQEEAIRTVTDRGWKSLPEEKVTDLRSWLERQQAVFDFAAKGAAKPWCRYSREWWSDRARTMEMEPWRIPIPELDGVEQLTDALVVLACSRAAEGKHREAREAVRTALSVADSLLDEPFPRCLSLRARQVSMILEAVMELLPAAMSADEIDAWLAFIPKPERFDGGLERAGLWMLKERVDLFRGGADRYWFWQRIYYRWGPMDFSKMVRKRLADPVFEADAIRCLDETRKVLEIWRKPYLEAKPEAAVLQAAWTSMNESTHPTAPLLWHVSPSLRLEEIQRARARGALIRLGLEWEKAKAKDGAFPVANLGMDPLTGKPFRFEEGAARLIGGDITGLRSRTVPKPAPGGGVVMERVPEPNAWAFRR